MTVRCTCFALTTGYNRYTKNYYTQGPDTMLPDKEKESDPAVAWHGLQRFLNHPNSGNRRLLALASVTGLEVLAMRILTGLVPGPLGPSGITTVATEGGQLSSRKPVLDGPGSGSCGHS